MPYTPTAWSDGVTPVNAANLNKIEAELGALDGEAPTGPYVLTDSVVVAGTRVQANKKLVGDAQPMFRYLGDGKHEWGPGGSTAPDISLYRVAATTLQTNAAFLANGEINANYSGGVNRVVIGNNGSINTAGISFGNAGDCMIYRSAAGVLKTDVEFRAGGDIYARQGSAAAQVFIGSAGPGSAAGFKFGTAFDTNLYRSAANTLKTDSIFTAAGGLVVNPATQGPWPLVYRVGAEAQARFYIADTGEVGWGVGGSTAPDARLYRSAAQTLKTDGNLVVQLSHTVVGSYYHNPPTAGVWILHAKAQNEAQPRFRIDWTGSLNWGDGTNPTDLAIYRAGTPGFAILQCDQLCAFKGVACKGGVNGAPIGSYVNHDWNGTSSWLYIDATGLGPINTTSDLRYKKNVRPLKSTWEAVKDLRPVSFRWRNKDIFKDDGKDHIGFVAQEMRSHIPSAVAQVTTPDGKADEAQPLALNHIDIVATLTKALQEAMARIEALEGKLA